MVCTIPRIPLPFPESSFPIFSLCVDLPIYLQTKWLYTKMIFLRNENENLRLALKLAHGEVSESCVEKSVCSGVSEELVTSSSPESKAVNNKEDTNGKLKIEEVLIGFHDVE